MCGGAALKWGTETVKIGISFPKSDLGLSKAWLILHTRLTGTKAIGGESLRILSCCDYCTQHETAKGSRSLNHTEEDNTMKNKQEREQFVREYRKWELWQEINHPDLRIRFYRHDFKNGAFVIVTECDQKNRTNGVGVRYNLILPESDNYNPFDIHSGRKNSEFLSYTLEGVGMSTVVDYMTKRMDEIS